MSRRLVLNGIFGLATLTAVVMEVWFSVDNDPATVPWTFAIVRWVPEPVTVAAITLLVCWLPVHFQHNYRSSEGGTMGRYAKTIVAVLVAGLTAATTALSDDQITRPEWIVIGLAALGAIGVFAVPNKTGVTRHDGT